MKKLWFDPNRRERSRRRQVAERKQAPKNTQRKGRLLEYKRTHVSVRHASSKYFRLDVPQDFSFVNNTEVMIDFLNHLVDLNKKGKSISFDFRGVKSLTPDAIAVFLNQINDEKIVVNIRGNNPEDAEAKRIFLTSGFIHHIQYYNGERPKKDLGMIRKRDSKTVEAPTARDLITFAMETLTGRREYLPGIQRVFVECMSNTINHASKTTHRKSWWSTVFCDTTRHKAYFTFLDYGVGIFKSVRIRPLLKMATVAGFKNHTDILWGLLEGDIGSRTGLSYRGKGLPAIRTVMKRGQIDTLLIVANDVYANVGEAASRIISPSFNGTLVHWEYTPTKR